MFTNIYAAQTPVEAEVIISLLRGGGVHPLNLEMSPHIFLAGANLSYHVRVPPEEAEAAKEILKANGFEKGIT
jgi:hypothetical protein